MCDQRADDPMGFASSDQFEDLLLATTPMRVGVEVNDSQRR